MASHAAKRKSCDDDAYNEEATTPTNSPPRKKLRITRNQKQALIDNLQLEITERARKLRAQYALQANDLRARMERRVNRIPVALRKANMGDLLEKHHADLRAAHGSPSPRKHASPAKGARTFAALPGSPGKAKVSMSSPNTRRIKKQSHEGIYSDKENAPTTGESLDVLKNPKRRGRPPAAAGTSRVVSQEVRGTDYRILSPKSSNSRTYPQSPLRASPEKPQNSSYLARPMSPLKPSSPLKSTSASVPGVRSTKGGASTSTVGRPPSQAKRPVSRAATGTKTMRSPLPRPATRQLERRGSVSSSASSGTTAAKPTRTGTGARKATTASTASTTSKKTASRNLTSATGKQSAASVSRKATGPAGEAPAGRRVLRKRA
ncbi:Borealin N terminal-domain-containing protein [Aspergillus ambiguus]|uniref:uncharacterized protein n=1 Tax=Aspergillus ambiguus TaxID=176160 RepID=UPI003CCD4CE5